MRSLGQFQDNLTRVQVPLPMLLNYTAKSQVISRLYTYRHRILTCLFFFVSEDVSDEEQSDEFNEERENGNHIPAGRHFT